jgi:hypothetical protein
MYRTRNHLTLLVLVGAFGCTKSCTQTATDDGQGARSEPRSSPPDTTPASALPRNEALPFDISLESGGLRLIIEAVPDAATLTCILDGAPVEPCADQGVLARPSVGPHDLSIEARRGDEVVARGSQTFVVPGTATTGASTDDDPLGVSLTGTAFQNGQHLAPEASVEIALAVPKLPGCKTTLSCTVIDGAKDGCDAKADSVVVNAKDLPEGLVHLTVAASCGAKRGPPLTLFVYRDPASAAGTSPP